MINDPEYIAACHRMDMQARSETITKQRTELTAANAEIARLKAAMTEDLGMLDASNHWLRDKVDRLKAASEAQNGTWEVMKVVADCADVFVSELNDGEVPSRVILAYEGLRDALADYHALSDDPVAG